MASAPPKGQTNWRALVVLTLFSTYFYAFMDWLFFVTKPSSLSVLSLFDKLRVLLNTGGILALASLAALAIFSLPALQTRSPRWRTRLLYLACLVPAFVLSVTALILFDNFTYTVFRFGIISTTGGWKALHAVGFTFFLMWMIRLIRKRIQKRRNPASFLALALFAASMACILSVTFSRAPNANALNEEALSPSAQRPNIIILGGDGLGAHYLSLYGSSHNTTPFLKELAKTSLLAENAFTNASSTTASTLSMITGREPAAVKVYRYPDILEGDASFEHLPGILKRLGYQTVQIGTPYYVDAQKANLLDGFDIVNNQSLKQPALAALRSILGNSPSTYFIWIVAERASERLRHIFFIRDMQNPLREVDNPKAIVTDEQRVNQILNRLDQAERPLFVFAHLMETHGPHFSSSKQAFSTSVNEDEEWDRARYEDAILAFDGSVQKIYDHLVQTGQVDNTILVIYTDHGFQYTVYNRIPILIHFPNDAHAGTRKNNIQVIDVPVTLLDYLGLVRPSWMSGVSFLENEPPVDRPIVSIVAGSPSRINPPFYQIKIVQVVVCNKWYQLNVQENTIETGTPRGHTGKCSQDSLPPKDVVHQNILEYLEKFGYDIGSLR